MESSYLSIASDGTPKGTRVTVINPKDGTKVELTGVRSAQINLDVDSLMSAYLEVYPRAVSVDVPGVANTYGYECPSCGEHVGHECNPPDFAKRNGAP